MGQSYRQSGDILTRPVPSGGAVSGRVYLFGVLALVSMQTAPEGELIAWMIGGDRQFPKPAGVSFTFGELAYYDTVTHQINKSAAGRIPIGAVTADAAEADTSVHVRLSGQATAVMQ